MNYVMHDYYNVTAITDTGGTVVERYGYSGFGDVRFMTWNFVDRAESAHDWDLLYKAQFRDGETGYYNYGYRYYVPLLGRWINRDPIEEEGGINLFGYVANSPTNENDYVGLKRKGGRRCESSKSCWDNFNEMLSHINEAQDRRKEAFDPKWLERHSNQFDIIEHLSNSVFSFLLYLMNFLKYSVQGRNVQVHEIAQYECRGDNALRILQEMVARDPELFEGRRGMMAFNDHPPTELPESKGELNFASTKWLGSPSQYMPMPCPYSLGWPQVGISDGEKLTRELLAEDHEIQSSKIFWIGANTHWTRARLCEMSREFPEQIDARLMWWGREAGRVELKPMGGYFSIRDHAKFKYLIDCAGHGYSGRLRWLLACGRPVFIVHRPSVEHWHELLVPWKHFVPIREDLSDLIEARRQLEDDEDIYSMICSNAKAFVSERLVFDREITQNLASVRKLLVERSHRSETLFEGRVCAA